MIPITKALVIEAINRSESLGASTDEILEALQIVRTERLAERQMAASNLKLTAVDEWLAACCNRNDVDMSQSAVLYDSYRQWGGDQSKQAFGRMLTARGFIRKTKNDGCYWCGLSLVGKSINDNVYRWIDEQCALHPRASLSMKALHDAYVSWGGTAPKSVFNRALDMRGFAREGYVWRGLTTKVALMTDAQFLEQERAATAARINQGV